MEIPEKTVKGLVLKAVKNVKDSDPVYKDWILNEETVILGPQSPMDSIAFTAFVTGLEEEIERELNRAFVLKLEDLYGGEGEVEVNLSIRELAKRIANTNSSKARQR